MTWFEEKKMGHGSSQSSIAQWYKEFLGEFSSERTFVDIKLYNFCVLFFLTIIISLKLFWNAFINFELKILKMFTNMVHVFWKNFLIYNFCFLFFLRLWHISTEILISSRFSFLIILFFGIIGALYSGTLSKMFSANYYFREYIG